MAEFGRLPCLPIVAKAAMGTDLAGANIFLSIQTVTFPGAIRPALYSGQLVTRLNTLGLAGQISVFSDVQDKKL
jgi:hypothetical protein